MAATPWRSSGADAARGWIPVQPARVEADAPAGVTPASVDTRAPANSSGARRATSLRASNHRAWITGTRQNEARSEARIAEGRNAAQQGDG